jgi:hypothetical protein
MKRSEVKSEGMRVTVELEFAARGEEEGKQEIAMRKRLFLSEETNLRHIVFGYTLSALSCLFVPSR